ncbi:ERF family protein [Paenibacillus chitinolyticus]|uniref:ERF family protein n=1 Tax=Paenibacillus chitinolyticus TaxID=79263 RepID=UPI0036DE28D7
MSEKTLVKKLAEVMQQVKYIQKTGLNKFHNYKYATEADVNEKVREELSQRNIILIPNTKGHSVREHTTSKGNREYIVTVEIEFTFMDGDSGESISFTTFGEGQDPGDKGTYKAITGAQKYALMKAFMIPTGDDPEADTSVDERNQASKPPAKPLEAPKESASTSVTPTIKAKYKTIKGSLDGLEEFLKDNGSETEKVLTKMLEERTKKGA